MLQNNCYGTTSASNQGALGVTKGFGHLGNGQGQEVTENDFLTRDVGTTRVVEFFFLAEARLVPPFSTEGDLVKSTTNATTNPVDLFITLWWNSVDEYFAWDGCRSRILTFFLSLEFETLQACDNFFGLITHRIEYREIECILPVRSIGRTSCPQNY